eukprot:TRINITY_DN990_c0_g1_i11.p1 TRINITY_DN990_c0_g1~~TRINITY_DN990_c0_g1_i11.p1  ORF type:complete len:450 (-),score=53.40 TRINITY_DN990_c0_g1_i11:341-1690(-)
MIFKKVFSKIGEFFTTMDKPDMTDGEKAQQLLTDTVERLRKEIQDPVKRSKALIVYCTGDFPAGTFDVPYFAMEGGVQIHAGPFQNFVWQKDQFYSWGINDCGQIAQGSSKYSYDIRCDISDLTVHCPTLVETTDKTITQPPKKIACGDKHTVILYPDSRIFVCGKGNVRIFEPQRNTTWIYFFQEGQLGYELVVNEPDEPAPIEEIMPIFKKKRAVENHLGTKCQILPVEITSLIGIPVEDISCGNDFTIIRTNDYQLFGFGKNVNGELGFVSGSCVTRPTRILIDGKVVKHKCGWNHTIALTANMQVYEWGNKFHDVADGEQFNKPLYSPTQVAFFSHHNICAISCGYHHNLVLCKNSDENTIYGWGYNGFGQLGIRNTEGDLDFILEPVIIMDLKERIKRISAGCAHTIVVTAQGNGLACGNNEQRQILSQLCQITIQVLARLAGT